MKKEEHLKNQVLYITNSAYDALQSENLLEDNNEENNYEQMSQMDSEK
ncbi:hypothetical protein [Fredinandcohnia onubensis]|nr:hypothetical protein [Fredinandcohnia onubensis]